MGHRRKRDASTTPIVKFPYPNCTRRRDDRAHWWKAAVLVATSARAQRTPGAKDVIEVVLLNLVWEPGILNGNAQRSEAEGDALAHVRAAAW